MSSSLFLHCHDGLGFVGWADDGEEGMIMMAGIEARDDGRRPGGGNGIMSVRRSGKERR